MAWMKDSHAHEAEPRVSNGLSCERKSGIFEQVIEEKP